MVSVELPPIKNTMLRRKKASEFIGSHSMEDMGDSFARRLVGFKTGHTGPAPQQDDEEGAPVAKRRKVEEGV